MLAAPNLSSHKLPRADCGNLQLMTLIITQVASNKVVQVSDTRLPLGREIYDAKAIKAILVNCEDARFVVGYTGVAEISNTRTDRWIVEAVRRIFAAGFYDVKSVVLGLKNQAQRDLENLRFKGTLVGPKHRTLIFVLAGYRITERGTYTPFYSWVTNTFVDSSRQRPEKDAGFAAQLITRDPNASPEVQDIYLARARACFEAPDAAARELQRKYIRTRRILRRIDLGTEPAARATVNCFIELTRQARKHPRHGFLVGPDCNSVVVYPGRASTLVDYHSKDSAAPLRYMPHWVYPGMALRDIELKEEG